MDNRRSKSMMLENIIVKEQRVDGCWSVKSKAIDLTDLRCILVEFRNKFFILSDFFLNKEKFILSIQKILF